MSAVFDTMVGSAVDNGYRCMAPWKILPSYIKGRRWDRKDYEKERIFARRYRAHWKKCTRDDRASLDYCKSIVNVSIEEATGLMASRCATSIESSQIKLCIHASQRQRHVLVLMEFTHLYSSLLEEFQVLPST